MKTNPREIVCVGVDWVQLAQGSIQRQAVLEFIMKLQVA